MYPVVLAGAMRRESGAIVALAGTGRRSRVDHRVRERGEPSPGPGDRASARARGSAVAGGRGVARRTAASHRERGAGLVGRRCRGARGLLGDGTDAASPCRRRPDASTPTAGVCTGRLARDRHALRHPSRDPRRAGGSWTGAEGLGRRRRTETHPPAARARRLPGRRVAGTPRRCRPLHPIAAARECRSERRRVDHALIVRVDLQRARYTAEMRQEFYESALSRLSSLPGVERAAIIQLEPFHGGTPVAFWARPGESTISKRRGSSLSLVPDTSSPPAPGSCAAAHSRRRTGEAASRSPS